MTKVLLALEHWWTGYGSGSDAALASTAGAANKGGGGGGGAYGPAVPSRVGAAGGSGFVAVNDPKGSLIASSVWNIREVTKIKKAGGNWY